MIKNTVKLTSDTFDYDMSNNKDYAVVNVTETYSNNSSGNFNGHSAKRPLSNLEMHPTANPIGVLLISLLFSAIISESNKSNKR